MKITETQLRKLIREEIEKASLDEMGIPLGGIFGWKKKSDKPSPQKTGTASLDKRKQRVSDKIRQINQIIMDLGETEPKLVKDLGSFSRYLNSLVKEI